MLAELGADVRQQHGKAERLGHVIVGAGFEAENGIGIGIVTRQHHNRSLEAVLTQDAHRLAAVYVRQAHVHDHQVDLPRLRRLHALAAVLHGDGFELLVQGQLFRQRIAQAGIIIDDENLTECSASMSPLMTDLAAAKFDDTVLEVGTGSGYQAAVLARLVRKVCTVEIIPPLAEAAANVLKELGYDNVSVKIGDGYEGWPECGPFDAVIVTAALGHVPPPLIEQLRVGGRLVMPLGPAHAPQRLTVIEKIAPSETRMRSITLVNFVPFTRSRD